MSKNDNWTLGLIDSAWFGSDYEGKNGREEAKRIGFESLDLFVGFDPGRMSKTNRERYVTENQSAGLPIVSLVCTCLGLSDFSIRQSAITTSSAPKMSSILRLNLQVPAISVSCPANICPRRSSFRRNRNGFAWSMRRVRWAACG